MLGLCPFNEINLTPRLLYFVPLGRLDLRCDPRCLNSRVCYNMLLTSTDNSSKSVQLITR